MNIILRKRLPTERNISFFPDNRKTTVLSTMIGNYFKVQHQPLYRSSHRRCSVKKGVLKIFANFTDKHLCWSLFLIKSQAFRF